MIRILESNPDQHMIVEGKTGIGRHTLIHHLFHLAPTFQRSHRFVLNIEACATALYESNDPTLFFNEIRQFSTKHRRALILVDNATLLIETSDKTEERRLARLLREINQTSDVRAIIPLENDPALRFTIGSKLLSNQCTAIHLDELLPQEIQTVLSEHTITAATEVLALARRFFHQQAAPGSAIQLWKAACQIATQRQEKPNLQHAHEYVSEQKGIPINALNGTTNDQIKTLEQDIEIELIGQGHAVRTVSRVLTRAHAGFRNETKPIASFLFLGPSGVGKTELAKILSRTLYQNQQAFHRIDMSEFSESHTLHRLIGAPPGYVGFEEGGQLTNPVDKEPYSLVLLDEIEKAHPKVFDVFLQLLDDGRLTDGRGKTVDFTQTTIVATSNIGLREIVDGTNDGSIKNHERFLNTSLLPLLLTHFRPEFLNRFDAIIVFEPLSITTLQKIGRREVDKLTKKLSKRNIQLTVSPETIIALSKKAYQPTFGARPMKRMIENTIESVVAERIIKGELKAGETIAF
jgi:ATP-dependent Clp protease ATP-binding subunit ClpA